MRSVYENYATFRGRATRAEYWWFWLFYILVFVVLAVVAGVASSIASITYIAMAVFALASIIPGIAVAVRRLHDTGRSGWWLLLGFIPFGGLVLLIFLLMPSTPGPNAFDSPPRGAMAGEGWMASLLAAGALFAVLYVLFYTSFLTNPKGLVDSLATFTIWTQTGGATQSQPIGQYLTWMSIADPVILVLGLVGGLIVAARGSDRVPVFFGLWALGITLAYSLISYKVPWIALNMLIPLAILGGIAINEAVAYVRTARSRAPLAVGAAALALCGCIGLSTYQAIDLNFNHYDTEQGYPYVFVHTTREALAMVDETERLAAAGTAAGATELGITFVTPEYWPLPWYYRDNPLAGFFGEVVSTEQAMIVAREDQEADLLAEVDGGYQRKGTYTLRPGVELVLWVRNDVAGL